MGIVTVLGKGHVRKCLPGFLHAISCSGWCQ